ncbi:putative Ig domain-containing protein [Ferrimonas balearica]|uniref:putative Ig domain-containing protein n=1 Tax=Ferrimonas balearica TaxID=44012 RepID=UPI001C5B86F1|nr:putative Ig domain-containing protein [Ferrimonas balearica]MBW3166443.1 hypothetical protein [Ferrimonas balearica]
MKKISLLAASIALVLSGCGGSDDAAPEVSFTVKAIDGYLVNAEVYAGEQCDTLIGTTDVEGNIKVPAKHKGEALCVKAIEGKTLDSSRGLVTKTFELKAPADSAVVSPMTNLVVAKMADGMTTQADAEAAVVEQFTALGTTSEQLFGDYIADAAKGDKTAQGITVIGETLVDETVQDDVLDQLIDIVADKVESDDDDLEDFDPVISDGVVTENHRPAIALTEAEQDALEAIEIDLGDAIDTIELAGAFIDRENDAITLSVVDEEGRALDKLGLAFNATTNTLTGTPVEAGEIELHVYATDEHGARSYPVEIEIEVNTPNQAPTVDLEEKAELEVELAKLALSEGVAINEVIDLDDLFNDEDDQLKLTVTTTLPGITAAIEGDDELVLKGTPSKGGDYLITVTATDGVHAAVEAVLKVSVEAVTVPEFTLADFLEGADATADVRYLASMNAYYFQEEGVMGVAFVDGTLYFEDNGQMLEDGTYEIKDDKLFFDGTTENDRFIYFSDKLALSVPDAGDLNAYAKTDFTDESTWQSWTTEAALGTWYFISDDAGSGSQADPMMAAMTFQQDGQVCIAEGDEADWCLPYEVKEGFLWVKFTQAEDAEPGDRDMVMALAAQDDKLTLVLEQERGGLPALLTRDEALANRLMAEWNQ